MNNLYLIVGNQKELIDFYLLEIFNKIGVLEEDKIIFDFDNSTLSDIVDEASMISLFSHLKVIIGNNFKLNQVSEKDYDYLIKYVKNINKDAYIIIITDKIDARTKEFKIFKEYFKIIELEKLNNHDEIVSYVDNYIKDKGYKISNDNVNYLVERLGNDINNIKIELEKIFIYKEEDKVIDRDTIDKLTIDSLDNIIYEFTNAVIDKDYDKISKMYSDFKVMNVGFDYLIVSLSNSFRQALIIKMLSNLGESNLSISKFIGKKEYYVKKMLERLYQYTEDDLVKCIDKLALIDREFKMGKSNLDMLELFLLGK